MENMHIPIIRLVQVADAAELKNLNDLFNDKDDTTLGELEMSLRENKHEIVVCADTGTIIAGVCCIQIMNTMCFNWQYAYITELFVRKEYRNKGIGTQMMKFAEQELIKLGVKKIFLLVQEQNKKAQKLYQSLGFYEMTEKMYMKEN